jgi:NAD(P)-dependent dehydrogenase (short-subunit alcohol dehydrogenase family)
MSTPWSRAFDFSGKVAVITGGSGVLFSTLAEALGAQGAAVVVVGHAHRERAQAVVDRILAGGGRGLAMEADVLDKASLIALADAVLREYGRVDILVNGAGGARPEATTSEEREFFDLSEDALRWVMDLNLMGTLLPCQVLGRQMAQQGTGTILNIASMSSYRPLTRSVAYSAAKAAVVNFTAWLAVHMSQNYSPHIRVNALAPGFFLTEQNRFLLYEQDGETLTERGRRILDHTPMGRLGCAEDLVVPAMMLLSDKAPFVHGATLPVDGGFAAYCGV